MAPLKLTSTRQGSWAAETTPREGLLFMTGPEPVVSIPPLRPKAVVTLEWLVGFYEGEGCTFCYTTYRGRPRLRVAISQADEDVLLRIKDFLLTYGITGTVVSSTNAYNYVINHQESVLAFIELIRHKMVCEKKAAQVDSAMFRLVMERRIRAKAMLALAKEKRHE